MGEQNKKMSCFLEVITPEQKTIQQLGNLIQKMNFYLGGGNAVAIHLGHRKSVDLDGFTNESIPDPMMLAQELRDHKINFKTEQIDKFFNIYVSCIANRTGGVIRITLPDGIVIEIDARFASAGISDYTGFIARGTYLKVNEISFPLQGIAETFMATIQ